MAIAILSNLSPPRILEGFYYKPRIDKDLLASHSRGLIALSGCLKGEINSKLLAGDFAGAKRVAGEYREILGRDEFLHRVARSRSRSSSGGAIPGWCELHAIWALIWSRQMTSIFSSVSTTNRMTSCSASARARWSSMRSGCDTRPSSISRAVRRWPRCSPEFPDALGNTLRIAERCELKLEFGSAEISCL